MCPISFLPSIPKNQPDRRTGSDGLDTIYDRVCGSARQKVTVYADRKARVSKDGDRGNDSVASGLGYKGSQKGPPKRARPSFFLPLHPLTLGDHFPESIASLHFSYSDKRLLHNQNLGVLHGLCHLAINVEKCLLWVVSLVSVLPRRRYSFY